MEMQSIQLRRALVGRHLHTIEDGQISGQGKVIAGIATEDPTYLIQWFDVIEGLPTFQTLVLLSQMVSEKWRFYETAEEWNEEGEYLVSEVMGSLIFGDET